MITDNFGLFSKTQVATDKTRENQAIEMMNFFVIILYLDDYLNEKAR